jgi:hypothetical protein
MRRNFLPNRARAETIGQWWRTAMRTAVILMLGVLGVGGQAAEARAAPVSYDFAYTQTAVSIFSGGTGTGNIAGQVSVENGTITGITGGASLFGAITGLLPPGSFPIGAENSNAFSAASPWLDGAGVSFTTATRVFNLSYNSFNQVWDGLTELSSGGGGTSGSGTLAVTPAGSLGEPEPVAEPASLALLVGGLLGVAATRRRRV